MDKTTLEFLRSLCSDLESCGLGTLEETGHILGKKLDELSEGADSETPAEPVEAEAPKEEKTKKKKSKKKTDKEDEPASQFKDANEFVKACRKFVDSKKSCVDANTIFDVLTNYDADTVSKLPEDQWDNFYADLKKADEEG